MTTVSINRNRFCEYMPYESFARIGELLRLRGAGVETILQRALNFIFPRIKAGQSFIHSLKAELPVIGLFTLATLFLNCLHAFDFCQNPILDTGLRVKQFKNDKCLLVCIDDAAYNSRELFRGRSPLDASKLSDLLESISDCRTPLIVVDLDTSDESFRPLRQKAFHSKKIVWAEGVSELKSAEDPHRFHFASPQTRLIADGVLGGERGNETLSGVPLFEPDPDGCIRRFKRTIGVETHGVDSIEPMDTLAFRAYQEYVGTAASEQPQDAFFDCIFDRDENEVLLNFSSIPERLNGYSVNAALGMAKSTQKTWQTAVGERIVIIGGTYAAARDKCLTPVGYIDGVKLNLMAIETLCSGNLTRKIGELYLIIADVMFGIAFVALAHFLTKRKLLYGILGFCLIGIIFTVFFYSNLGMLVSFIPISFGLLAHLCHEYVQEYQEMQAELKSLNSRESKDIAAQTGEPG